MLDGREFSKVSLSLRCRSISCFTSDADRSCESYSLQKFECNKVSKAQRVAFPLKTCLYVLVALVFVHVGHYKRNGLNQGATNKDHQNVSVRVIANLPTKCFHLSFFFPNYHYSDNHTTQSTGDQYTDTCTSPVSNIKF